MNLTDWTKAAVWLCLCLVVLYCALGPGGVLFHEPLAAVGCGLIGLGLLADARRRFLNAGA